MNEHKEKYDDKGNASHYNDQRINVIHHLEKVWGTVSVMEFCEMNAFKYRMRIGKKDATEQELKKIKWYEIMALYLKNKSQTDNLERGLEPGDHPLYPGFIKMLEKATNEHI